jgi:hypothetical protein
MTVIDRSKTNNCYRTHGKEQDGKNYKESMSFEQKNASPHGFPLY